VPGGGEVVYSVVSALTGDAKPARELDGLHVLAVAGPGEFVAAVPVRDGCSVTLVRPQRTNTRLERFAGDCGDVRFGDVHDDGVQIIVGAEQLLTFGPPESSPQRLGTAYVAASWLPNVGVDGG
jgi:hypothetical protein